MPFASKYLLIQHFNCLDYIPLNINLSLSWISLLGILGNLVTISLLYKSLCVGCLFINKQFTGVHLWGVLCVELPPSTDPRGRPIPEGRIVLLWIYNNLVSLLCLWTYSWRLCSNLNYGHILEEHGCPIGSWTTGLSGWTPALSLSITMYIL